MTLRITIFILHQKCDTQPNALGVNTLNAERVYAQYSYAKCRYAEQGMLTKRES